MVVGVAGWPCVRASIGLPAYKRAFVATLLTKEVIAGHTPFRLLVFKHHHKLVQPKKHEKTHSEKCGLRSHCLLHHQCECKIVDVLRSASEVQIPRQRIQFRAASKLQKKNKKCVSCPTSERTKREQRNKPCRAKSTRQLSGHGWFPSQCP
jgi:hypothetical protein